MFIHSIKTRRLAALSLYVLLINQWKISMRRHSDRYLNKIIAFLLGTRFLDSKFFKQAYLSCILLKRGICFWKVEKRRFFYFLFSVFNVNESFKSAFFAFYLLSFLKNFKNLLIQNWWWISSCLGHVLVCTPCISNLARSISLPELFAINFHWGLRKYIELFSFII